MLVLGQYAIDASIHEGAENRLYRGHRVDDGSPVVLKLPRRSPPNARDVARLQHEYAILRELALPGVVKALALEPQSDGLVLVLEALPGQPLDAPLRGGRLPLGEALAIGLAVAEILAEVHARGVIHRDLKPANIIVAREPFSVTLIDFGLATRLAHETQRATSPDALAGTLAYLSPEQTGRMNRAIDHRTDFYSLGVTLYQMLTGALPFPGDDPLELVHSHIARTPAAPRERVPELPAVVSDLVMKLLAKSPEDRYQSARGLAADLQACLRQLEGGGSVVAFPLARHEQAPALRLPQRLYGREEEVAALLRAFERAREGAAELVLVSGYAGIGKSALVHELDRAIAGAGGYFTAGKFDQLARNTPYAALVQALRDLVRQVLGEREGRRAALREALTRALDGNAQVLVELIPELSALLGPQPPVAELGPTEAQNRFYRVFDGFVQVLAGGAAPLVVFLDDLQWADAASIKLLGQLVDAGRPRRLLVIAAYRDNEVDASHPLSAAIGDLKARGAPLREVRVGPLKAADLVEMLADALGGAPADAAPLARVVYRKTQGNPFFIHQLLRSLQHDRVLRFDAERGAYGWDLATLEEREVGDDVVDFMSRRIRLCSPATQRALRLAACVGHRFDLDTLAAIGEMSPAEAAAALWEALEEGLVIPEGGDHRFIHHTFAEGTVDARFGAGLDIAYRFSHDRVQQAAYALIPEEQRAATHLQIGRMLRGRGEPRGDAIFAIADQLGRGAQAMTDPEERRELCALALAAGRRAKTSTAYAVALGYLRTGESLLPADAWARRDPLAFALRRELAECAYLTGEFAEAEALFERLVEHAPSEVERAGVYILHLRLYQVAGRYDAGVDLGATALARLGVALPSDAELDAAMQAEREEIERRMQGRAVASLIDAPRMADPTHRAIMALLVGVMPCAYIGRPRIFPYLALRGVSYSLRHGNTEESCFAYSVYGFMLVSVYGQIPQGYEFSEMSIALNERLGDATLRGTLLHLHGDHINFWRRHIRTDLPILEQAFHACLSAGDLVYGSFLAFETVWQYIETGAPIEEVRRVSERFLAFAAASKNEPVWLTIRLQQQFLAALAGTTAPGTLLDGDGFDAEDGLERVTRASFGCGIAFYHVVRMILLYSASRYKEALAAAQSARAVLGAVMAMPIEATFYFFEALALIAAARQAAPEERALTLSRIEDHLARLALWARHCPENFEHKHLLVRAEEARLADRPLAAEGFYDEAIASARRHGFVQYEALACELCGSFYRERERSFIAPVYLRAAYYGYSQWGALAKAEQLAREVPHLIGAPPPPPGRASASTHGSTASSVTATAALDLATVVRLGQALTGEIELDRLLERLMRLVLQNAGGTRGVLLLAREGELEVAASCTADRDEVEIYPRTPLSTRPDLPATVIEHVARTRQALVLADVSHDARFAADPALAARPVRSVLCLALVHRRRMSGVLYIEHALSRDVFTRERVELLEALCSQAVTAVENAQLYRNVLETSAALSRANEHLEEEVRQRTTALQAANERLSAELQERARAELARAALQEEVIRMQEAMLAEMSTPLIPITDSIVVVPLIGTLDERRSERLLQTVLEGAQSRRARVVILDITGMTAIDTPAIAVMMRAAHALRLLGTRAVLTGTSPIVAQMLVDLEVDTRAISTFGTLQAGIAEAVRALGGGAWRA